MQDNIIPGTTAKVTRLPDCDFDPAHSAAMFDGRTTHGPWANMCKSCHEGYGVGVGYGKGQMLILVEM